MAGVLVYVGAVEGGDMQSLAARYERVLAVQALKEEADKLRAAHPAITVIHAAATKGDTLNTNSTVALHVASSAQSSSLGPFDREWVQSRDLRMVRTVQVPSVNLYQVCREHKIETIDLLVCDAQGSDHDIVASMAPFLKERKIKMVRCKTTRDGFKNLYEGLSSNELKSFRQLFDHLGYQLSGIGWGDVQPGAFDPVPHDWWEFHTTWTPKASFQKGFTEVFENDVTWVAVVYGGAYGGGNFGALGWVAGPLVVFCDDEDGEAYLGAWRERSKACLLDRTMFVTKRWRHLPLAEKYFEKVIKPKLGGGAEGVAKLAELAAPQLLASAALLNPFASSSFALLSPLANHVPQMKNVEMKGEMKGGMELGVAEGLAVWGARLALADRMRAVDQQFALALDAGHLPDASLPFSNRILAKSDGKGDEKGEKKEERGEKKAETVKVDEAALVECAARAKKSRELGLTAAALDQLLKVAAACPGQSGGLRRGAVAEGKFWSETMLCAWFCGEMELARSALDRCTDLDPEAYELAGRVAQLVSLRLSSLVLDRCALKLVEVPVGRRPNLINGNLTILPYGPKNYVAVSRLINWIGGQCVHPQRILTNENAILLLDSDFRVVREDKLVDATKRITKPTGWTGFEDIRLYHADADTGTIHFVSSLFDHEGGPKPQMARCMAKYMGNSRWDILLVQPLNRIDANGEKNWLPFKPPAHLRREPETLWAVYHWHPRFHLLEIKPDGSHTTVFRDEVDRPGSFHQGSCAPIYFPPLDCYLALIHLSWNCFFHRFVLLDKETLRIRRIGPMMYLHRLGIEYACGMCLSNDKKSLVISYGLGDSSSHIIQIPTETVFIVLGVTSTK